MSIKNLSKLKESDFYRQVAFAYLTCERLYPNYVFFSQNYDFGDPLVLRGAIDYIYGHLFEQLPDLNNLRNLIDKVEENTPDTEDFNVIFVSAALDACTSVLDSLDFLIYKDCSKIEAISTYATDTVYMYIQGKGELDLNDEDIQERINDHPLMKREIAIQTGIINFFDKNKTLDYGDIQFLLQLQESEKRGSLNL